MIEEETLVVRESRASVAIGLLVCIILLGIASLSIGGRFNFAAIVFAVLTVLLIGFLLWLATFVTVFTSTGINGRSFGRRRDYTWREIESWGLEYDPNGDYSIWFKTGDAKKRRYVQALGDDTKVRVRAHLTRYCGEPLIDG